MRAVYLDLEWDSFNQGEYSRTKPQILEIGAAVADLDTLRVEQTFGCFVRPPNVDISLLAASITGISRNDLLSAKRLPEVLAEVEDFLNPKDHRCVAWGDDTEVLRQAAVPYRISSPFRKGMDLSFLFRDLFLLDRQLSVKDALIFLGLPFDGACHSALLDAVNTAYIHMEIIRRTRNLENTEKVLDTEESFQVP